MSFVDREFADFPDAEVIYEIDCDLDFSDIQKTSDDVWATSCVDYRWVMFGSLAEAAEFVRMYGDRILSEHRRTRAVTTLVSHKVEQPKTWVELRQLLTSASERSRTKGASCI